MSDSTALIVTIVVVVIVFGCIFWLDRRSKPKKNLQEPVIALDQGNSASSTILRPLAILILGIAMIVATFYGVLWVRGNPVAGFPIVIAWIVLYFLLRPLHAILFIYKVIRGEKKSKE
jgi:hypothetical protein